MLIFDRSAAGGIFLSSERKQHKDACVSVPPLPSLFCPCFQVCRAPARCVFSPSWLPRDLRVRSADVSGGRSGVRTRRSGGEGVVRVILGGALAAEGELGQRHGLVRETLRGQHGEGVTWRAHKKHTKSEMKNNPCKKKMTVAKVNLNSLSM